MEAPEQFEDIELAEQAKEVQEKERKEEEQREEEKQLWVEFYSSTTLHGFHFLFDQTGFRRLVWIVVFLACLCFSAYLFSGIVNDFGKHKTTTITSEEFDRSGAEFPSITVCKFNSVSNISQIDPEAWGMYRNFTKASISTMGYEEFKLFEKLDNSKVDITDFLQSFELSMKDMLYDKILHEVVDNACMFEGEPCTKDNFTDIFTEEFGLCHQFNAYQKEEKPIKQISLGYDSGLNIYLNIHTDSATILKYKSHGIALFIHPYGSPAMSAYSTMINLAPGTYNVVYMTKKKTHYLKPPYESDCGTRKFKVIHPSFPYTKSLCEIDCIAQEVLNIEGINEQGCLGFSFAPYVEKNLMCNAKTYVMYKENQKSFHKYRRECKDLCPLECDVLQYEVSISHTLFGTEAVYHSVYNVINNSMSRAAAKNYVRENIIGMQVSFRTLSTTREKIIPAGTWESALGSIGGSISLCLGFSLLTAIEFLFFAFNFLFRRLTK